MRNFFHRIPFLRIASLFAAGILFSHFSKLSSHFLALLITVLISILLFFWHSGNYAKIRIQNLILALLLIISGMFYPQIKNPGQHPGFSRKNYFLAEIRQKPVEKSNSFQTVLTIQNSEVKTSEKIITYFSKDSYDSTLQIGDQLVILAKPQLIRNQGNPYEFDYQSFIHKKGIWFSTYLPKGTWLKTGHNVSHFSDLSEQIRQHLLQILSNQIKDKEERSVIEALTLGYREELDPETKDYFASTGAMHVLAVSGLHVGLIYFILGFLFSGIKRNKAGRALYPLILILLLWFYAFLTGFSPSVQRATVMFTFVTIGESIRRPVNIFNSLSASALVLLLINPEVIFEVGFQLSYLAVFGIVLIQPKLSKLISVKNSVLKVLWQLFTVSVAAQLATFPLGLFYFNQVSNLFWLSNFVVIPCATIIICVTFAFFVFSFIPAVTGIFGFLLKWTAHLMIHTLKLLSTLTFAVTDGVVISPLQVLIIYGMVVALLIFVLSKHKRWFFLGLILLISFQISNLTTKLKLFNQKVLFVYNSPGSLIHLINGRKNYLISFKGDSISDLEFRMAKRVQDHLQLNEPIIIKSNFQEKLRANDLQIKKHEIRFLNCKISSRGNFNSGKLAIQIFKRKAVTAKSNDLIKFDYSPQSTSKRLILRKASAYYFSLKNE